MTPIGGENTPPIDSENEFEMGDSDNLGMDEMPQDNQNMDSEFDTNFDAGVEADEETDPKKYIQQLTGKLSQTLNTYNNENGEPDTELGKYVLGMLVKQGTKGMDEKDRKEIIKKINTNDSVDNDSDEEFEDESNDIKMESKTIRCTKKQIFENFGIAMDDNTENIEKELDTKITNDTKKNRRTKPFEAPKKFR